MSWDNEKTNVRYTGYVHGGVEADDDLSPWYEMCKEAGIDPDSEEYRKAQSNFCYALYELTLDLECDLDTGVVRCWGIEGKPLVDPVRV